MAEALGEAPTTVQSWKAVGRIPATKQPAVLEAAKRLGLEIRAEDVVFPMGVSECPTTVDPSPGNSQEVTDLFDGTAARTAA